MYKISRLFVFSLCSILLLGCGKESISTEDTSPASNVIAENQASLEELQKQLSFKIILPTDLPHGLQYAWSVPEINPNTGKLHGVTLIFQSSDQKHSLNIKEIEGNQIGSLGDNAKDLEIAGQKAQYAANDRIAELLWTNGQIVFYTFANANTDLGNQKELVDIAKKFK